MLSASGATAAGSAAMAGAFSYNRANYMYDSGQRFGRFMAGYGYVQGQTAQYREDIRDLTALATGKQDVYHTIGVIFFVLNFQLIMAGRLGVHGPSPPGWLLGIYWTNVVPALMFLTTAVWLTMHASSRATAGSVHMLTRTVRIPIPSPKQLDKARKTGNSYEKQRMTDIFRVPFAVPAPKETIPEDAPADDAKKGASPTKKAKPTGGSRRMPKWFQDEQKELNAGKGGPAPLRGSTPEHFELYRGLQQEWAVHDCYARIGLLYFMSNWLTSISLMSQCHVFTELRNIWPAWTVSAIFCTAHFCILKCDIVEESHSRLLASIPLENFLPFTPMICVLGMSLDYSTISPNDGWIAVIYILSWFCYITHFAWALRLYEMAMPHPQAEQPEAPGQFWYPAEWWLPRAFANSIYIVAAPKHLEPGQTCLTLEMKAAKGTKGSTVPQKKQRDTGPMLFPWRIFRGALITNIALWCLIIFGRVFEQVHGERQILKQEGRVMRWPSHMQPWMTPWTRHSSRNEWSHTGGSDRRLSALRRGEKVTAMAERLAATLEDLAEALDVHSASKLPVPLRTDVAWPSELRPALLASKSEELVAALTREGRGALLNLPQQAGQKPTAKIHSKFVLQGINELGELLGASWGTSGLLVTSTGGQIAECTGQPVDGVWACKQVGAQLPHGGSSIKAATAVRIPGTGLLRAAVTFADEDGIVLLDADLEGKTWTPSGEVQLPQIAQGVDHHFSFSAAGDELMISSRNGGAMKWNVGETEPSIIAAPETKGRVWHAACNCGSGLVAHLASPSTAGSMPELLLSSRT